MSQYIKEAVKNVESNLKEKNLALLKHTTVPITPNYTPEVDSSPELSNKDAA